MNAGRFAAVRELFDRALALPAAARERLLDDAALDPEVCAEVRALLARAGDPRDLIAAQVDAAASATVAHLPQRIGPYRVCGVLGEGGMGLVVLGERDDGAFSQRVAIKRLRGLSDAGARERLLRERQLLAQLDHPHIARLLDGGTAADGEPYLVMQLIDGRPLSAWASESAGGIRAQVAVMAKVCRAVHHAHQHLIVHRDLKPDNIMVRADGEPALLDFGIAKLFDAAAADAAAATRIMTPAYASPEQLQGRAVTTASDIFALGLVLYELLTGAMPERAADPAATSAELVAPSRAVASSMQAGRHALAAVLRGDLDRIVRKAVRSDPGERYASAEAMAGDLEAWLDGRAVRAADPDWRYLLGKFVRRHRLAVAASVVALLALAGLSLQLRQQSQAAREAQLAAAREAAAADETGAFLQSLFSEIDPNRFPGRRLGALELLDLGRARLDAMSQARPAQRAGLALRLAVLYGNAGRPDRHLELAEAARDLLAGDSDDPALALRIAVEILRAHVDLGHWREGRALADATLHSARSLGDRAAQARVLLARGQIAAILLDQAGAEADYALAEQIETARAADGAAGLDALNFARAELAQANGAFADASARYQQSFEARLARLGADHPDTLRAQFGMAIAMNFMGRTSAARALYAEVGERTQRVFGPRSEALAVVIAGMATADRRLGHYVEAERGYREALSIHEEIGGESGSAKAADQLGNLSRMRQDIGDLDAAEELNERAMAIRLRLFGADSPWVALSWQNLADYRLDRGNLPGARVAVDQALRIRRAEFVPGHFLRLISEATLLVIDAREGRELDGSRIDALRQALALAPFNTRLSILQALAAAALATRDTAGSIAAVADELRLLQQRHPEPHPWIGITRLRLAEAMAAADDMGQARAELERAVPTLASTQTAQSPWLTRATRLQQVLAAGH